jgi:hypothetical protein
MTSGLILAVMCAENTMSSRSDGRSNVMIEMLWENLRSVDNRLYVRHFE